MRKFKPPTDPTSLKRQTKKENMKFQIFTINQEIIYADCIRITSSGKIHFEYTKDGQYDTGVMPANEILEISIK